MKKYNITVNGKKYEVEVEEIGGVSSSPAVKPAAVKPASPAPKAQQLEKEAVAGAINAPMPGTILDIKIKEGQQVNAGDILLILEAMKMENEIVAPADGVIKSIMVEKGNNVSSGDALIIME